MTTRAEADSAAPATTRRGLLIGGAAAAIGGAFAARGAFSHAASVGGAETGHAPRPGGELVVAFDGTTISTFALDPHNSGFAPHNRVMRSVYDSLTRLLPDQSIGPWLAESWTISERHREECGHQSLAPSRHLCISVIERRASDLADVDEEVDEARRVVARVPIRVCAHVRWVIATALTLPSVE